MERDNITIMVVRFTCLSHNYIKNQSRKKFNILKTVGVISIVPPLFYWIFDYIPDAPFLYLIVQFLSTAV